MFFHVMVGATDLEKSRAFYDATFAALGIPGKGMFRETPMAYMYGDMETGLFFITKSMDGKPETHANGGTIMFKANSKAEADAWYAAGMAHGGMEGTPPAAGGLPGSIMSRMRDPTGNKVALITFV